MLFALNEDSEVVDWDFRSYDPFSLTFRVEYYDVTT